MTDQDPTGNEPPPPDFNELLSQLGEVTSNLQAAQAEAAAQVVEGSAGGGAVRVTMTAGMEVESVIIDPTVIDPAEAELLGDLVLAAFRDAVEHANQVQAAAMGGVGLGGAGGLLGL
ncbi:MAG: YbaB/EbfC family nucleoid-associated protein [Actinomycetota bacterium]|nr:YbaB/EbfC family nucleoid-associated protein [Actinomycetota bacterium]